MVAIGVGTLTWVLLVAPYIHIGDLDLKTKLTAVAYPTMDLLLAAVAIRLAVGAGRRPTSFYLIIAAIGALFTTDAIYGWFGLYSAAGYQPGSGWLEAGWATFYVLLGTAALHPSMRELTDPAPELGGPSCRSAGSVLATTSLMAPAIIASADWRGEPDGHGGADRAPRSSCSCWWSFACAGLVRASRSWCCANRRCVAPAWRWSR